MEREIGMMEERVKSGKRKTGISGLRPWKREEGGFPVVERERIVGDGAGEKCNCAVSRGGRGGRDETENGESGFSGMGGWRDSGYAEGWEVNRKRRGQEVGAERGGDARRWSWERGRSGGSPERGEEDDRNGKNREGSWRGWAAGEEDDRWVAELEMKMAARRSGCGGGSGGLRRRQRLEDGGIAMTVDKNRSRGKDWRRSSWRRHEGVRRRRRRWLDSFLGLP